MNITWKFGVETFLIMTVCVFPTSLIASNAHCTRTCSESLKSSIGAIIGKKSGILEMDKDMLSPLHAIIAKSSNIVAKRRINWICYAMKKFEMCSRQCPDDLSKFLQLILMSQWKNICDASTTSPEAFAEYLRCEKAQYDLAAKRCGTLNLTSTMPLRSVCRIIRQYSNCYTQIPFHCSSNASEIRLRVNSSVRSSYDQLVDLSSQHVRIPAECQQSMDTTSPVDDSPLNYPRKLPYDSNKQQHIRENLKVRETTPKPMENTNQTTTVDYWMDESEIDRKWWNSTSKNRSRDKLTAPNTGHKISCTYHRIIFAIFYVFLFAMLKVMVN
ncbi:hypothetical protein DdX_07382 [Ditylenchus destructor]|uniref:Uncharacterized protein n=1 Tax=Ditylenchus destructor TaxID=166010 RepID=A0AAD4N9F5_9BILA|nr:hypothetical protein DdX_07382 [Ditylenchus destructor]